MLIFGEAAGGKGRLLVHGGGKVGGRVGVCVCIFSLAVCILKSDRGLHMSLQNGGSRYMPAVYPYLLSLLNLP